MRWLIRGMGLLAGLGVAAAVAAHLLAARLPSFLEQRVSAWLRSDACWSVDPERHQWRLASEAPAGGILVLQGPLGRWRHPQGDVLLQGVKTGPVTVSTTVRWDAAWTLWPPGLRGTLTTAGTLVNRQPVSEVSGTWRVDLGGVTIHELALGSRYRVAGSVGCLPPYPVTLTLDLTDADAARVAALIEPGKNPLAGGIVQGRVAVTGSAGAPHLRGTLAARNGKLGATTFEAATLEFDGEGSVIRFTNTRLRQPGAEVVVEGFLDVTKLGTPTVFQDMRLTPRPLSPTARMAPRRQTVEGDS